MALNSFQLFLSQVQAAPEVLKIRVLQVVFDILMVHEGDFLANGHVDVSFPVISCAIQAPYSCSTGRSSHRIPSACTE